MKSSKELIAELNQLRTTQKNISSFTSVSDFMKHAKENAEKKSNILAAIELNCWDEKHESELKNHFGYNDKKLSKRKNELKKTANAN